MLFGCDASVVFFFFKQKTAYEITYGDWSSDVCSSDLLDQIFPSNGDTTNLQTLVTSCDYIEIFWFPFTTQLWVKRFSKLDAPTQYESKVIDFVFITSELASLTGGLMGEWFKLFPFATPLTLQIFFFAMKELMQRELKAVSFNDDFDRSQDPIVKVE